MTTRIATRRREGRRSAGFTLIELLVVITILGVISAVVVFSVRGVGDKGKDAARRTDADILRTAEESYFATRSEYGTESQLVTGGFLSEASTLHDIELGPLTPNGRYAIVCQAGTECSPPTEPVAGGTLVVAIPGPTTGVLNPAVTSEGVVHTNVEDMFNGLVGWSPANEPTPELAESWQDVNGDAMTFRFTLRDDVFWHDDDPTGTRRKVTSDDVLFSFEEVLLRYHSRTAASLGPALDLVGSGPTAVLPPGRITTPDPLTVVFNLAYPVPSLPRRLNVTEAPIIPRHVYGACADLSTVSGCPANRAPVGSGPFEFESVSDLEIHTVRNPGYFRPGLPYLDGLVKRVVRPRDTTDEGAVSEEVTSLESGAVDWVAGVGAADVNRVVQNTTLRSFNAPRTPSGANCMSMLAFNLTQPGDVSAHSPGGPPPAPNPRLGGGLGSSGFKVRSAIARAFDRQGAYTDIDQGVGTQAGAPISSALPDASAQGLVLPTLDLAGAADLLTEAGWIQEDPPPEPRVSRGVPGIGDGASLLLDLRHAANAYQAAYADAIAEQLAALGIELEINDQDYSKGVFVDRTFDLALVSYCNGDDPQVGVRRQYHSDQISPAPFTNASGYDNSDMDRLWDEAAQAATPALATAKYREIQEAAVRDLPYLWFTETRNTRAHRGSCTGFNHFNTGLFAEAAYCRPAEVN